jgi:hypothetical protein
MDHIASPASRVKLAYRGCVRVSRTVYGFQYELQVTLRGCALRPVVLEVSQEDLPTESGGLQAPREFEKARS